jgi:hypothetical protein
MVKLLHISCCCYKLFHHESVNAFATFGNLWSILEFWEFSTCQIEICGLCTIVFLGEAISNLKSLEFVNLRFKHYILGKVVSIFAWHLCAFCFWEKWSLFLHHIYGRCVFRRGGLCLASHLCASCLYALCFWGRWSLSLHHIYVHHVYMHCVLGFGIENHLHLGFKGKTFSYSFGLHGLCIALCLCVSQVASHLKIIYTFKYLNVSPLTTTFISFILWFAFMFLCQFLELTITFIIIIDLLMF